MSAEESMSELTYIVDREKIRDRLVRLSRGVDRRDAELIRACYWPEASDDEGVASARSMNSSTGSLPGDPAIALTLHTLGQSLIELDGDTALAETHVTRITAYESGTMTATSCCAALPRPPRKGAPPTGAFLSKTALRLAERPRCSGPTGREGFLARPFVSEHPVGLARGDSQ